MLPSHFQTPSSKYRVEDPNPLTLWRAQSPVHPTLPRRATVRTWNGTVREKNPLTASLTGPGRAGKQGELLGQKGSKYVGEVLAGRPHGQGQYLVPKDGLSGELVIQFEGTWVQGRREGQGTRLYPTDEYYTGEWVSNLRHGQGRYVFGSGEVYSGGWMDDKRSGPGTYYYTNGDIFVGGFAKGRKEGMGTLYMMTRQRKYVAEYIANNPRCGTVLEIDDMDLEPLRGQLQSLALQRKLDLMSQGIAPRPLPPCQLEQPNQVLAGEVVGVRTRREAGGKMLAALQEASGTLGQRQVEMLRHSFVLMAAGDDPKVGLLPHQLGGLSVVAGMDPSSQATWALLEQLLARKDATTGRITYDSFLQVVLHFQDAAVLQPVQQDPPSTGGNSIMEAVAAAAEAAAAAADCSGPGSDGGASSRSWDDGESRGKASGREGRWGGPDPAPSTAGGEGEAWGQHGMAAVAEDGEEEFVEDSQGEGEEEEQFDGEEEEEAGAGFEEDVVGQRRGTECVMDPNFDAPLAQSVQQDHLATHSRGRSRQLRRSEEGPEAVPVNGVGDGGEPTAGRPDIDTDGLQEMVADLLLDGTVAGEVAPTGGDVGEGAAPQGIAAGVQLAVVDSVADGAGDAVVVVVSDMGSGVEQPTAVQLETSQQDGVGRSGVAESAGGEAATGGGGEDGLEGAEGRQELDAAAAQQVVSGARQQAEAAAAVVGVQESRASHSGRPF
ncbi:MAG: hypothetical protein WDW36_002374 [Sanguina aurantia]